MKTKQELIRKANCKGIILVEELFPLSTGSALLLAPKEFADLTHKQKQNLCNGCGYSIASLIVRDSWFGISFYPACCIHDYTYQDIRFTFNLANNLFEYNLNEIIKTNCNQNMKRVLIDIASTYVVFVKGWIGRLAYYTAKKK